ncbi:hypothetical protein TRP8649_03733 [Pelagimonas phthalicica]|uniref:Uncharacterized protein n=1 Tax=Pelagimonas phthalicica TaxID=1037362 RepID=A0A238JIF6_9RHOB|nr:hypothetical protein [Pelagimonas phthalicica]TDS89230.1 hypothetical protein CLV87_4421 [Pelagimonas phthalicica]SMX29596.1 hypothetical protein TRP8649_03733 [Pelagimonas phthalicica]
MKQERDYSTEQEPESYPESPVALNASLEISLKAVALAESIIRERPVPSVQKLNLSDGLQNWRIETCKTYLERNPKYRAKGADLTELARSLAFGSNSVGSDEGQGTSVASIQTESVKGFLNSLDADDRAATALKMASELVEYAGYVIAQQSETREVIPTFLLAQTLSQRARDLRKRTER